MNDGPKDSKWETDYRDLQNELAGREVGRIQRFLPEPTEDSDHPKAKEKKRRLSVLEVLLMTDESYAALYHKVEATLHNAERAVDRALNKLHERLETAGERLENIRSNAYTLPDGTRVYWSRDQRTAFTEDGHQISEEDLLLIPWNQERPTWEDYQATRKDYTRASEEKDHVTAYRQHILEPTRERLGNPEHPPSEEELTEMLEGITEHMPEVVEEEMDEISIEAEVPTPNTNAQFNTGPEELPNLSQPETVPSLLPKL